MFLQAIKPYQEALDKSGYNYKLQYEPMETSNKKNGTRKRKIVWFNPPFSKNVRTNIGSKFLKLIDKHFPSEHHLHHLINRGTVKVSYRCMPNLASIISSHNAKILNNKPQPEPAKLCNCRKKDECPLKGKCLTDKVVYRAIVNVQNDTKTEDYIGITGNKFKTRYTQHKSSFKPSNIQSTTLSQYINKLNSTNKKFNIEWSILRCESTFSPTTGRCNLCIAEKYIFLYRDTSAL